MQSVGILLVLTLLGSTVDSESVKSVVQFAGKDPFGELGTTSLRTAGSWTNSVVSLTVGNSASSTYPPKYHVIVVLANGSSHALGANDMGQCGIGSTLDAADFKPVLSISTATQAAAGTTHSLWLLNDGTVMAAGENHQGQLGDGTTKQRSSPVIVTAAAGLAVSAVAASGFFDTRATLLVREDGVLCGIGSEWQSEFTSSTSLTQALCLDSGLNFTQRFKHLVTVSRYQTAIALDFNGTASFAKDLFDKTPEVWFQNASVSAGIVFDCGQFSVLAAPSCMGLTDAGIHAKGYNRYGALGDGSKYERDSLVKVELPSDIQVDSVHSIQFDRDAHWSVLLLSNGTVLGTGDLSRLWLSLSPEEALVPTILPEFYNVELLVAGLDTVWLVRGVQDLHCPPGQFFPPEGTACLRCPSGSYSDVSGPSPCIQCPPGYTSSSDRTSCKACPREEYAPDKGSSQCSWCPYGTTNLNEGSTSCPYCKAGRQIDSSNGRCVTCAEGFFNPEVTQSVEACQPCPYSTTSDFWSTGCECAAGFYISGLDCLPCASGEFKPYRSNTSCEPCPSDLVPNLARTLCVPVCNDTEGLHLKTLECLPATPVLGLSFPIDFASIQHQVFKDWIVGALVQPSVLNVNPDAIVDLTLRSGSIEASWRVINSSRDELLVIVQAYELAAKSGKLNTALSEVSRSRANASAATVGGSAIALALSEDKVETVTTLKSDAEAIDLRLILALPLGSIALLGVGAFFLVRWFRRSLGTVPMRTIKVDGQECDAYDVFISYRVQADADIALRLWEELQDISATGRSGTNQRPLRVFLDQKELKDGEEWQNGFVVALFSAKVYVVILSAGFTGGFAGEDVQDTPPWHSTRPRLNPTGGRDHVDNCLLEVLLALELQAAPEGRMEKIFPVFVGPKQEVPARGPQFLSSDDRRVKYRSYFGSPGWHGNGGKFPKCISKSTSATAAKYLRQMGFNPTDITLSTTIDKVMGDLTSFQGQMLDVFPNKKVAMATCANKIALLAVKICRQVEAVTDAYPVVGPSTKDDSSNFTVAMAALLQKRLQTRAQEHPGAPPVGQVQGRLSELVAEEGDCGVRLAAVLEATQPDYDTAEKLQAQKTALTGEIEQLRALSTLDDELIPQITQVCSELSALECAAQGENLSLAREYCNLKALLSLTDRVAPMAAVERVNPEPSAPILDDDSAQCDP